MICGVDGGSGISSGNNLNKIEEGDLIKGITEGTYMTLLSSLGSEGSLGKEDLGVLASEGMSPISLSYTLAVK